MPRRSTAFWRSCSRHMRRRASSAGAGCGDRQRVRRVAGHADSLLHVSRPRVFACVLGVCGRRVCRALAARTARMVAGGRRRAWRLRGLDGNGPGTGSVHGHRARRSTFWSGRRVGCRPALFRWSAVAARAVAGTAAVAFCFLPQVLTYVALFGRPAPSATVQSKMTWTAPHVWRVLASPANGLLFWTPLALAGARRTDLAGDQSAADRRRRQRDRPRERAWIGVICLVMVATQFYLGGALDTWAGAGSFGQRRLVGLTIFFVIGLTAVVRRVAETAGRGTRSTRCWCLPSGGISA